LSRKTGNWVKIVSVDKKGIFVSVNFEKKFMNMAVSFYNPPSGVTFPPPERYSGAKGYGAFGGGQSMARGIIVRERQLDLELDRVS